MVLEGAIQSAGGLKGATYGSEIEISRSINVGKKFSVSNSFVSISDEQAMQTKLQAMDIINLKQIPTGIRTVEITGEVYFAGIYPISENQTLSELIKRAGGITEYGSLKAAYFQRQSLREAELERLQSAKNELKRKILLSSQSGGLGQNSLDNNSISQLTSLIAGEDGDEKVLGRLVVDLESIIQGLTEDLILEDGDTLYIPTIRQSIAVIGEVFVANSHLYKDDLSISDYLDLSGGANAYADVDNVYLIKSDGSIVPPTQISARGFFKRSSHRLQPGDTIVVPLEVQPFSGIKATTEITQIIYQMALAAAAVNSF
jgi:polysaccharide export outer membrane protein